MSIITTPSMFVLARNVGNDTKIQPVIFVTAKDKSENHPIIVENHYDILKNNVDKLLGRRIRKRAIIMPNFKIMNPGRHQFLNVSNGATIVDAVKNPINGVAFNFRCNGNSMFQFPSCDEVWVKCGVYVETLPTDSSPFAAWIGQQNKGFGFQIRNTGKIHLLANGSWYTNLYTSLDTKRYYNILFHARKGESDGFLELFVNGKRIGIYNGNVTWDGNLYISNSANNSNWSSTYCYKAYFSNIIISDAEIKPTEELYVLNAKTTETDMSESTDNGNLVYTANAAGQTLLQTIDTDALSAKVGTSNLLITGVGVGAAPIYYEGEGLTHVGIMTNEIEQEEKELSTTNTDGIVWGRAADYSLENLATLKLGWKAKE